jgi:Txe/YoeB family toxin of Txe-Axe toxin-antitoxin module
MAILKEKLLKKKIDEVVNKIEQNLLNIKKKFNKLKNNKLKGETARSINIIDHFLKSEEKYLLLVKKKINR